MDIQQYTMELKIVREMHHSQDSMFGIYACRPVHFTEEIEMNSYNNFSIKGQTRKLIEGETYMVTFDGAHPNSNPRFDDYYSIIEVEPEKLDTVEDQDRFLQAIITEKQFESLKEAYPHPNLLVDLILEDKIDTNKTNGIKGKTMEKIKFQVEQNAHISVLIAKLNTLNLSTKSIDKLLTHFQSSQAVLAAIEDDIYNLCEVSSFGFATVDKSALGRGDKPENKKRIAACLNYLLKQDNQSGHTWSHEKKLLGDASDLLQITLDLITDHLAELKNNGKLYVNNGTVARPRIRQEELSVREHLYRIHASYVSPSRERVEGNIWAAEEEQGFRFTDEQRQVIIDSSQDGVSIINGAAGSGKTAIVKGLLTALGISNYMTCALSGKAAYVLSERGIQSSTIHRMLGYDGRMFKHNEHNPLEYDVIVIDELSMVNTSLLLSVISAVPEGTKLILVGDSAQLSSIGYGDVLRDLLDTGAFPAYELTQVHRQAKQSGVLELANLIRSGESLVPYNSSGSSSYGEGNDQNVVTYTKEEKDNIPYDVLRIAESYKEKIGVPEDILDFQVIVSNRGSGALSAMRMNTELQKVFNDVKKPSISRSGYDYRQGDKVIAIGNTYKLKSYETMQEYLDKLEELKLVVVDDMDDDEEEALITEGNISVFNGTMGLIKGLDITNKLVFVQFEGIDGLIPYTQTQMEKLSLGYVITTHRSQGSGFKHVLMAIDYSSYMLLDRKLIYTGVTRSSSKGILLAENNALLQALQNEGNERRTFLRELLFDSKKDYTP